MEKLKVEICVGTICHLMGAHELVSTVEELPNGIKERIEYSLSPCFNVCNSGMKPPIVKIAGKYFENVTPDVLKEKIIEALEGGG